MSLNIIHKKKGPSNDAIAQARQKLVNQSLAHENATQKAREAAAAKEAHALRGHTDRVMGKPVACIPEREFYRLTQKYGHENVHTKEFIRDLQRLEPDLCPNRV